MTAYTPSDLATFLAAADNECDDLHPACPQLRIQPHGDGLRVTVVDVDGDTIGKFTVTIR